MLKGKTLKEKAEYFWMYYKGVVIVIVSVLLVSAGYVHAVYAQKETAFYAMLADSYANADTQTMSRDFADYAGINLSEYDVEINPSYLFSGTSSKTYEMTSRSKFYADIGTQKLDAAVLQEDVFENYVKADCFADLRECLNSEQLAQYEDWIYYDEEIPVGIYVENMNGMKRYEAYTDSKGIYGIIYNGTHREMAVTYLEYLMQ